MIRGKIIAAECDRRNTREWAERIAEGVVLGDRQALILMGSMLYWGEGTKLCQGGYQGVAITNTDPGIISIAMRFFRVIVEVPEHGFTAIVRMDKMGDFAAAEEFWSLITGIPRDRFGKPELLNLKSRKSLKRYPHGMCRVVVNSVSCARKIDFLIKIIYKGWQGSGFAGSLLPP